MMSVRSNVFETNSSSTHSITITTRKNYDDWKDGLIKFNEYSEKFTEKVTMADKDRQACKQEYEENKPSYYKDWKDLSDKDREILYAKYARNYLDTQDSSFKTFEEWHNEHCGCEFSAVSYTTEHGDQVVAFGYGGYE